MQEGPPLSDSIEMAVVRGVRWSGGEGRGGIERRGRDREERGRGVRGEWGRGRAFIGKGPPSPLDPPPSPGLASPLLSTNQKQKRATSSWNANASRRPVDQPLPGLYQTARWLFSTHNAVAAFLCWRANFSQRRVMEAKDFDEIFSAVKEVYGIPLIIEGREATLAPKEGDDDDSLAREWCARLFLASVCKSPYLSIYLSLYVYDNLRFHLQAPSSEAGKSGSNISRSYRVQQGELRKETNPDHLTTRNSPRHPVHVPLLPSRTKQDI